MLGTVKSKHTPFDIHACGYQLHFGILKINYVYVKGHFLKYQLSQRRFK